MKVLNWAFLLSVASLALCSCNEESWVGQAGKGGISLNLRTTSEVVDAVPQMRASTQTLEAPEVDSFGIVLEKQDGSYSKSWDRVADFNAESGFDAGAYTMKAVYGSENEEGFEKPYFLGSTQLSVLEGKEVPAEITASLANSMVSIAYTDAFMGYFSSWSAQVHSDGHSYIDFSSDEVRPAFIAPGDVSVAVTMKDASGREVTLQPAAFIAEPRHHYHITFDVNNGAVGDASLVVKFDDSLVQEDVTIDLTEELFTTPAPSVKSKGFEPGARIEILEGTRSAEAYKFQVLARGGLKSAVLTVNSADYTPSFGNEIDLMSASEAERQLLSAAGVDCAGLWKNPDQMALVDISGLCSSLPAGNHEITLVAKDRFTRISEPVTININVVPVTVEASVSDIIFGAETAVVDIEYNGDNAEEAFTFRALDNYGSYVRCDVVSVEEITTRSFEMKKYRFVIAIPISERENLVVAVYYRNNLVATEQAKIVTPKYNVSVDPYSQSADIYVEPEDAGTMSACVANMRVYIGGSKVPEQNLKRNASLGLITVYGLKEATDYHLQTTLVDGKDFSTDTTFKTETEAGIPNGGFETLEAVISNVKLNSGGQWTNLSHWIKQQSTTTFNVSEPTGWATVNAKTFNTSASTKNTWFIYPSTINVADSHSGSNAMLLRSVGYAYSGSAPEYSRHTGSTPDYCTNVTTVANRAAGKLFLGTYAITTSTMTEQYNEGVAFTGRPSALKGYYKYVPYGEDKAVVKVELYNGTTLVASGSGSLSAASAYTEFNVPLVYEVRGMHPTQLRIMLCSTENASYDAAAETANVKAGAITEYTQAYVGSQLTVDDLSFAYQAPQFKAKARKAVKVKKNRR